MTARPLGAWLVLAACGGASEERIGFGEPMVEPCQVGCLCGLPETSGYFRPARGCMGLGLDEDAVQAPCTYDEERGVSCYATGATVEWDEDGGSVVHAADGATVCLRKTVTRPDEEDDLDRWDYTRPGGSGIDAELRIERRRRTFAVFTGGVRAGGCKSKTGMDVCDPMIAALPRAEGGCCEPGVCE